MYTVRQIQDRQVWETFVQSQPYTLFVQSWVYGEFYQSMGEKFWVFGVFDEGRLVGGTVIVSTTAKRGKFLYAPYGPLLPVDEQKKSDVFSVLVEYLRTFGRQERFHFLRMSPFIDNTSAHQQIFKQIGFVSSPLHVLAEQTWLLALKDDEDVLLQAMKKNHRNLIRRCEREGVRIEISKDTEALEDLQTLLDETAKRHQFTRFSRTYVKKEFDAFSKDDQAVIFRAFLPDGTLDAASMMVYYGNMGVYRHSGSYGKDSKLPTSYLIQWEAIKEAKRRGMAYYNFWGIAPADANASHPFFGITHFKKGFGGKEKSLLHCQDLPLSPRYWITWLIETIRRIKRGF